MPIYSNYRYEQYGEECRQSGRKAAAREHTFKDQQVVRMLQRHLMEAEHTIQHLAESLEDERVQHKEHNPDAHNIDLASSQRTHLEMVRGVAEIFSEVAFESLEELRVRALASEAVWGA